MDDSRAAHRESGIPPDNQGIRRGTDFPFQRATIRDLAPQFGKEEERKTDRRNGRGNEWLTVHESDRFQAYYRRYRNSGNRNGSNNRKRSGKHCGKCRCGCRPQGLGWCALWRGGGRDVRGRACVCTARTIFEIRLDQSAPSAAAPRDSEMIFYRRCASCISQPG